MDSIKGARATGAVLFACLMLFQAAPAAAQVTIPEEYGKTIKTAEVVGALGNDLFGDETNLYTGSTSFAITDASLPGNDALPVAVGRRYVVEDRGDEKMPGLFADWELDLPHLQGTFARGIGWQTYDAQRPHARCSVTSAGLATPPDAFGSQGGIFAPEEFWHGHSLHVPGHGAMDMLVDIATNPNRPTDGNGYYWTTSGHWFFSCLPAITDDGQPGAGEGFLARAPEGTRYWFDWMVSRPTKTLKKAGAGPTGFASLDDEAATMAIDDGTLLAREEVRILPTRIEDRFGNWVVYDYDEANPWRLLSITSKDGRVLAFTYNAGGRIATVSDGTRTWTYTYAGDTGVLTQVTLPDNTRWLHDLAALGAAKVVATPGPAGCELKASADAQSTYAGTITHPSGAVGTFTFRPTLHGRAYVQKACMGGQNGYALHAWLFDAMSIQSKTISGTGLSTPAQWTYTYGPTNHSWLADCPNDGCVGTKTVEVTGPSDWSRHTFSNRWRHSEGKLLKVEQGSGPANILRTDSTTYLVDPTGQRYPAEWGSTPFLRGDRSTVVPTPVIKRQVLQQGRYFTWKVDQVDGVYDFDHFARPTKVTRSSASTP